MRNTILAIMIVISLMIGAATLRRGHDWGDDFAWYIMQAKSIVDGTTDEFMEESAFTNYESTTHLGPLAYPWGYPLILVPAYAIKGISPLALKLPALVFFAAFLVCLYLLLRDRLTEIESLILVCVFAFNPLLLQFLDQILSDIPFLFFSTLALFLMTRKPVRGVFHYVLIGTAVFAMAFLRVTGVLLLGCFLMIELFSLVKNRSNRKQVWEIIWHSFIVCLVFALLWIINLVLLPSGGESYFSQYESLLTTAREFAPAYFNVFGEFFGRGTIWRILYYVLLILFLFGAWLQRKQEPLFLLFFVLWLLIHLTYPYWQGARYIFPLLPIFIYFTFQGMKAALVRLPAQYRLIGQRGLYGFWVLLASVFLITSSANAYSNLLNNREINGPFDPYSREVYSYIKEKTAANSVVIFFKPRVMVMMTGHPTIMSTECDRMLKGDYLVLSRKVGENQQIVPEKIDECNLPLNQVLKNSRFVVYEVQK